MGTSVIGKAQSQNIAAARYRAAVADVPDVLEMVADICRAPMAALKVVGDTQAHVAAAVGMPSVGDVPKSASLCDMVSETDHAVAVDDAAHDPRMAGHPLVAGAAHVKFLAAAPLHYDGHIVGALCVFDPGPREIDAATTIRFLERIAKRIDSETALRHLLTEQQPLPVPIDQDEVVMAISHEVRTPLTVIRGQLELLADTPGAIGADFTGQAEAVRRNANRLCRTVDNLLRAVNQSRHAPIGERTVMDLRDAMRSVLAEVGPAADRVLLDLPGQPVWVTADQRLLEIAVSQLLNNALHHGGPRAPVVLSVSAGPEPTIEVRDQGPGLDETELSRLGTAFYRCDDARRQEKAGLGLGISISRRICEAQGASLTLHSVRGSGVVARISFPTS
ncbi:GAF domain-containing sensor histidine kinase [Actinoplanes sp. NPDC026619]|uniref:GAF domain-containing sensor histidine kinase n=1 Tax=Actinoplanes sp. NPDC026619 TaxID=3155798 RepID=UPI0033C9BAF3